MTNRIKIWLAASTLLAAVSSTNLLAQTNIAPDPLLKRGKSLVIENCARCHSVEAKGDSPHTKAPPFRDLLKRYPIDALEEGFADKIYSQHPDMPVFEVNSEQLDAILYYIESIQSE